MATQRITNFISPEEYLEIERNSEFRSEYIAGEVIAMASASKAHGQIVVGVSTELNTQLRNSPCEPSAGVSVAAPASYLIPDIVVYCDGGKFTKIDNILQNPVVIVEILSPSTADFDHGHKWIRYQQIPSLMHYVLIAQDVPRVEVFSREEGGWHYVVYANLDDSADLSYINCRLSLAAIYERVSFDEPSAGL